MVETTQQESLSQTEQAIRSRNNKRMHFSHRVMEDPVEPVVQLHHRYNNILQNVVLSTRYNCTCTLNHTTVLCTAFFYKTVNDCCISDMHATQQAHYSHLPSPSSTTQLPSWHQSYSKSIPSSSSHRLEGNIRCTSTQYRPAIATPMPKLENEMDNHLAERLSIDPQALAKESERKI